MAGVTPLVRCLRCTLQAPALAIASAGAATLQPPGRHQHNHDNGWHSTPRTVELDDWSAAALADWHGTNAPSSARPGCGMSGCSDT